MNKRVNTLLFILAATVANILTMMVLFVLFLVVFARFVAPSLPPQVNQIMLMVLFLGSVISTYLLYHRLMRWASKTWDLQKYFGPLFGKERRSPE
ncbi:hypothetical protein [Alkalispirochaeta alkalica]|uniref:hypothetical protein n=1 Tax=Alkalispirochaeta alkalica TaxID=46356 RepID=UPI0003681F78|nr:hypothetical protein [Alkalispirochaeta alkalica]